MFFFFENFNGSWGYGLGVVEGRERGGGRWRGLGEEGASG